VFDVIKKGFFTSLILLVIVVVICCFSGCLDNSGTETGLSDNSLNPVIVSDLPEDIVETEPETAENHSILLTTSENLYGQDLPPYPSIIPDSGYSGTVDRSFTFLFQKSNYTITVPVDKSVYYGARSSVKRLPEGSEWDYKEWLTGYYRAFFSDPNLDSFYEDLLLPLQRIQRQEVLSESEYLELLITFVQQVPYDSQAISPRFAIETIYDQKGDCDEKSLLLAGLLEREGYDVALFFFPDYQHAVAGIRVRLEADPGFHVFESDDKRDYVFIETTVPQYIGRYPEVYEGARVYVVPVGNGTMWYTHMNYISHITDTAEELGDRLLFIQNQLDEWRTEILTLEEKLNTYPYTDREEFDSDYARYNQRIQMYNDLMEKGDKIYPVYQYILDHPYDVLDVYRYIENTKVSEIRI